MTPDPGNERQPRDDPAQARRCEACRKPGVDIITVVIIGEGGDHTGYAHRSCTVAAAAGAVSG